MATKLSLLSIKVVEELSRMTLKMWLQKFQQKEKIDPADHMIIWRDSNGRWDGWNHTKKDFIVLNGMTMEGAAYSYIDMLKNS